MGLRAACSELLPLFAVLLTTGLVLICLPSISLGHTPAFRRRRFANWFCLGLTYAFMYMGRYNLTVAKNALGGLMTNDQFGTIFFWGTLTYGCAFVVNGPLADYWGGRRTILIAAFGSSLINVLLGWVVWCVLSGSLAPRLLTPVFCVLYPLNMYFQSFGAVSIMKVNASWFHLRERGVFGGIFGIIIALGLYLAFDWGRLIVEFLPLWWLFFLPAIILAVCWVIDLFFVRDQPSDAGHADFDPADASSSGPALGVLEAAKRMLRNPVIVTIGAVEFCSGFLRNAVMHWYVIFANQTGLSNAFVARHWGMLLCGAGIIAGVVAGALSDHFFSARRGPVAALLYIVLAICAVVALLGLHTGALGWVAIIMTACVIGVHGILSGTASMDFGGRRNVGLAVGIIDGLVYLGTATQALLFGKILPEGIEATLAENWLVWPIVMLFVACAGLILTLSLWHARPLEPSSSHG